MKIEETLRQNKQEQFKSMTRTALDGFWVTDVRGRFLEVNDAYGYKWIYQAHSEFRRNYPADNPAAKTGLDATSLS